MKSEKTLTEIENEEIETKKETEICENIFISNSRILDCYNFSE